MHQTHQAPHYDLDQHSNTLLESRNFFCSYLLTNCNWGKIHNSTIPKFKSFTPRSQCNTNSISQIVYSCLDRSAWLWSKDNFLGTGSNCKLFPIIASWLLPYNSMRNLASKPIPSLQWSCHSPAGFQLHPSSRMSVKKTQKNTKLVINAAKHMMKRRLHHITFQESEIAIRLYSIAETKWHSSKAYIYLTQSCSSS